MALSIKLLLRSIGAIVALSVGASSVALAQGGPRERLSGVAYTIHVTSTPRGASSQAGAMVGTAQDYLGRAVFAADRGRMDIVDGMVEPLFTKGDYILFDSTDLVIVHPASRSYAPLPHDVAGQTMERLQAIGVKMTIAAEKVVLDSLGLGDTVAGIPTSHYRMTTAFTMSVDAGVAQQRLATESVTDYWVASVPGLPRNPLLRANGLSGPSAMTGMFKSISLKVDSVAKRMGSAVALRTSTVSRLIDGQGANTMTEQSSDVSRIESRVVDDSLLVLPADYKPTALLGVDAISDDAGAKWRVPPRPRTTRSGRPTSRSSSVRRPTR
jgi:hypothetical protein